MTAPGFFTQIQGFANMNYCILDVELGDLNSDGYLDAVLVDYTINGWNLIMLNDGTGHLVVTSNPIPSKLDTYAELGDLDGDGDLDLFVVSGGFDIGTIRIWKNDGTGIFSQASDFDNSYEHIGVALGDLDGDGDLDAFTTGWYNTYNKVWLNDGSGAFTESQAIPHTNTYAPLLGDLDDDGDLDVYLSNTTYENPYPDEVWLNDGNGLFTDSDQRLETVSSAIPALGDLDADGDLDVYLSGSFDEPASDEVWKNDGTGTFSLFHTMDENYPGGIRHPWRSGQRWRPGCLRHKRFKSLWISGLPERWLESSNATT